MDTKVIIGSTVAGAAGYFGAKIGVGLDDTTAIGAGIGLALVAGGAMKTLAKPNYEVSDEQQNWEKELAEGAKGDAVEPTSEAP